MIVIATFVVLSFLATGFATAGNVVVILRQASIYGVMVLGVTLVLAAGELDLAFPSIAAFASMMAAFLIHHGMSVELAAACAIATGAAFGVVSGVLVTVFRFPSLISTIAVSGVASSLALAWAKGQTIVIPANKTSLFYMLVWDNIGGVPIVFLGALLVFAVGTYVQNATVSGQYIYALGDNRSAAEVAGIKGKRVILVLFIISAFFAAVGGILLMMVVQSGQPNLASSLFLDGFTMVFLGTMVFKLGKPNMLGTYVGAFMLAMLGDGLTILGMLSYVEDVIKGALLIVGVVVFSYVKRRRVSGGKRLGGTQAPLLSSMRKA